MTDDRDPRRIPFRAMIPNAITALALCFGLTGVSLAINGNWERALGSIILAGVLDGLDGRIARLLRAQSKFGAELDSLLERRPRSSCSFGRFGQRRALAGSQPSHLPFAAR
jgi:hypothetical protein